MLSYYLSISPNYYLVLQNNLKNSKNKSSIKSFQINTVILTKTHIHTQKANNMHAVKHIHNSSISDGNSTEIHT